MNPHSQLNLEKEKKKKILVTGIPQLRTSGFRPAVIGFRRVDVLGLICFIHDSFSFASSLLHRLAFKWA